MNTVIDIEQIEKLTKGQNIQEDIIIENLAIPVLAADFDIEDYRSYLAVLDGDFIKDLRGTWASIIKK